MAKGTAFLFAQAARRRSRTAALLAIGSLVINAAVPAVSLAQTQAGMSMDPDVARSEAEKARSHVEKLEDSARERPQVANELKTEQQWLNNEAATLEARTYVGVVKGAVDAGCKVGEDAGGVTTKTVCKSWKMGTGIGTAIDESANGNYGKAGRALGDVAASAASLGGTVYGIGGAKEASKYIGVGNSTADVYLEPCKVSDGKLSEGEAVIKSAASLVNATTTALELTSEDVPGAGAVKGVANVGSAYVGVVSNNRNLAEGLERSEQAAAAASAQSDRTQQQILAGAQRDLDKAAYYRVQAARLDAMAVKAPRGPSCNQTRNETATGTDLAQQINALVDQAAVGSIAAMTAANSRNDGAMAQLRADAANAAAASGQVGTELVQSTMQSSMQFAQGALAARTARPSGGTARASSKSTGPSGALGAPQSNAPPPDLWCFDTVGHGLSNHRQAPGETCSVTTLYPGR
jgi:hypothetical protein